MITRAVELQALRRRALALGCWDEVLDRAALLQVVCTEIETERATQIRTHGVSCSWPVLGSGYLQVSQEIHTLAELDALRELWSEDELLDVESCSHCRGELRVNAASGVSPMAVALRELPNVLDHLEAQRARLGEAELEWARAQHEGGLGRVGRGGGGWLPTCLASLGETSGMRPWRDRVWSQGPGETGWAWALTTAARRAWEAQLAADEAARGRWREVLAQAWDEQALVRAAGRLRARELRLLLVHSWEAYLEDSEGQLVEVLRHTREIARTGERRRNGESCLVVAPAGLSQRLTTQSAQWRAGPWGARSETQVVDVGAWSGEQRGLDAQLRIAHALISEAEGGSGPGECWELAGQVLATEFAEASA